MGMLLKFRTKKYEKEENVDRLDIFKKLEISTSKRKSRKPKEVQIRKQKLNPQEGIERFPLGSPG